MRLLFVRQRGGLDSLCVVRLLNDVPGSVYTKFRDPLLVFSFSFCCFLFDDHGACSANMWLPLENGLVFAVCVWCAWYMRGKKGACKTSNHLFDFLLFLCLCVCVCVLAENGKCPSCM